MTSTAIESKMDKSVIKNKNASSQSWTAYMFLLFGCIIINEFFFLMGNN